ncbi:MAG: Ig-like domain-containing protein, partial [Gemmatimonadota bacterium]
MPHANDHRRSTIAVTLLCAALAGLAACGDDEGTTDPTPDPDRVEIAAVELSPTTATLTEVGATHAFDATANDADGETVDDVAFVWQSSDATVATVDTTGLVTARGPGEAIVTATARGVPGNATVVVNQAIAGLGFRTEPTAADAGAAISPAVQVEVRDSADGVVEDATMPITLELADAPDDARLLGTTTVHAVNGVATFSGLAVERAHTDYSLVATSPGIPDATSEPFAISPLEPEALAFLSAPASENTAGEPLGVEVAIQDVYGNTVTEATDSVTLLLESNPSGGTLVGTTVTAADAGVAHFDDMTVEVAGAGYALEAAAHGDIAEPAVSDAFVVRAAAPDHIGVVPPSAVPGGVVESTFDSPVELAVHDAFENLVDTATTTISLSVAPASSSSNYPGAELSGTLSVDAVDGFATFDDIALDKPGEYELVAAAPELADTAVDVAALLPVPASPLVAAGGEHACIPTSTGPFCWGANDAGQLGDPDVGAAGDSVATAADSDLGFGLLAAGAEHTCGTASGDIYCWGSGADGRLGTRGTADEPAPTRVADVDGAREAHFWIAAGDRHNCVTTTNDGFAYCWGDNASGQLGIGTTGAGVDTLTQVTDSLAFTWIAAGADHTCAIGAADSLAYCWGANESGQLGDGNMPTDAPSPVQVSGGTKYVYLEAGAAHTCAVEADTGDVECWGANDRGQLGDDNAPTESDVPVAVAVSVDFLESGGNEFAIG